MLLFFFPVTLALFSIVSTVAGLTVLEPSSANPWYAGQKNFLRWTNATWDVTSYNYDLGLPWNATLFSHDPWHGGAVALRQFNGTDGEAVVDMSRWQEQGTQFILQCSYYAANRGPINVVFGSSENFTIAASPSTVVKTLATRLSDSAQTPNGKSSLPFCGLAVVVVLASVFL